MEILKQLKDINPQIDITGIEDTEFAKFGRIVKGTKPERIIKGTKQLIAKMPVGVVYEASVSQLETFSEFKDGIIHDVYGGMPVQIGWCYGHNNKLDGLEFHQCSEVIVAVTDIVLLLGHKGDINFADPITYDANNVKAFYCGAGSVFELYSSTLHYAPTDVFANQGFIALIILQKGTNSPIVFEKKNEGVNKLLSAVNTWSIMHPEAPEGYVGIEGDNIEVNSL